MELVSYQRGLPRLVLFWLSVFPSAATAELSAGPKQTRIAFTYQALPENIVSAARVIWYECTATLDYLGGVGLSLSKENLLFIYSIIFVVKSWHILFIS